MSADARLGFSKGVIHPSGSYVAFDPAQLGDILVEADHFTIWHHSDIVHGHPIFWLRKPAHVLFDMNWIDYVESSCWLVSYQGWHQGVWCDGPIIHLSQRSVATYVPEGYPVCLSVPLESHVEHNPRAVAWPDFAEGLMGSLVTALRTVTPAAGTAKIVEHEFNLATYTGWVLLKKARPQLEVWPHGKEGQAALPSGARRICQNLGWPLFFKSPPSDATIIDLKPFSAPLQLWDTDLATALNQTSAVIPASLISRQM